MEDLIVVPDAKCPFCGGAEEDVDGMVNYCDHCNIHSNGSRSLSAAIQVCEAAGYTVLTPEEVKNLANRLLMVEGDT